MAKTSKRHRAALSKVDREKRYSLEEALKLAVDADAVKFDETRPKIDRDHDGLRTEVTPDGVDEHWVSECGGVHAHLVGAGIKHVLRIAGGADAATHGERDEQLAGGAPHSVEQGLAALMGRSDVEEDDFIRAFASMTRRLGGWIACVDKVDELWNLVRDEAIKAQGGRGS